MKQKINKKFTLIITNNLFDNCKDNLFAKYNISNGLNTFNAYESTFLLKNEVGNYGNLSISNLF